MEVHRADLLDGASQVIAVVQFVDTRWRACRDQVAGTERQAAGEKPYMIPQTADHLARVRAHDLLAILQDLDR